MYAKIHSRKLPDGRIQQVVAICDAELLGQVFEEGERVLDLKTYEHFYKGEKVTTAQAIELLQDADNVNLVGPKAVAAGKTVFKTTAGIRKIAGVPHLQIYRV